VEPVVRAQQTGQVGVAWTPRTARASAAPPREEAAGGLLGLVRRTGRETPALALAPLKARAPAAALREAAARRLLAWVRRRRWAGPARALAPPVVRAQQALTMALALAPSMVRDSAAVGSEAPERAVKRRSVLRQERPRMEGEPVLPPGSWQIWVVHPVMHLLLSGPPLWRP